MKKKFSTPQSKGAKILANSLTAEERHQKAKKAIAARWKKQKGEGYIAPLPVAEYCGIGKLGDIEIEGYVLRDGTRLLSYRKTVELIAEKGGAGDLASYIDISPLKSLITMGDIGSATIEFNSLNNPSNIKGLRAETFAEICSAYVKAGLYGYLTTIRQKQIAARCAELQDAFIKLGIVAFVDEITGYQSKCKKYEYETRINAYISEQHRKWHKTWPDLLYKEWARLQGISDWKIKPRNWAQLTNAIYDLLGLDVSEKLKEIDKNPNIDKHQYLTEHFGCSELKDKINYAIGVASFSNDLKEYSDRIAQSRNFGNVQLRLFH